MADSTTQIKIYTEEELKTWAFSRLRYLAIKYGADPTKTMTIEVLLKYVLDKQQKTGGKIQTQQVMPKASTTAASKKAPDDEPDEEAPATKAPAKAATTKGATTKRAPAPDDDDDEPTPATTRKHTPIDDDEPALPDDDDDEPPASVSKKGGSGKGPAKAPA